MASNGFAPPPPRPATVETVETANLKTSSSSSDPVAAFHMRLIDELLADLRRLAPRPPAHQGEPLAEELYKADSWASLRILLRTKLGPPGAALLNGDVDTVKATSQIVLAALDRIGAAQLARECGDLDDQNASPARRTDAVGLPATDDGGRWRGLCDLLAWLSAIRSALVGETAHTTPESTIAPAVAVKAEPKSSRSPMSAVVSPAPSFGFAPPPQPGQLAKKHNDERTDVNAAPPTPGQPMSPPEAKPARAPAAAAPVAQEQSAVPASVSVPAAGSKAAAFAMRMSGLSGPPAAVADVNPIASTSTIPTGPPSAGFAPPPAPGASAFDKKPKARVRKPRVSAPAAVAAAAATGAAHADEPRPKTERKISVKIRDALANGGDSPPDEFAPSSSSHKGKKRFTSYDELSESDHDDGELDELASDYEEQLERKRRKLDANGGGGSGSDASKKQRPRTKATPRDPAAEKAHRLALLAQEEAELAQDPKRFKVGQAVIARFPNYSYWPAMVLDPLTAPPKTQGTRVKGAYLVKSIPTGADHRWVPPDDSSILPVTTTQLDDIILGRYKSAPPPSWKKWRGELVDAAMMIKDEARLKEWAAHPTPTELWHIAQAERKKAARASAAW